MSASFVSRHIGINADDQKKILEFLKLSSVDELIDQTIPKGIINKDSDAFAALSEVELQKKLTDIFSKNQVFRSFIGTGYHDCHTPYVIQRNVLENPAWYTQYTPYQAEIAQGRLEALFNFQTMISELCGLEIANSSLLDEATAAAEAMYMSYSMTRSDSKVFFVSDQCHPQTIEVVQGRAKAIGVEVLLGNFEDFDFQRKVFGALLQYPDTKGKVSNFKKFIDQAHEQKAYVTLACDPLSLLLLKSPGELGADIAVGSAQRFGVPMGYGGPHAGFFATKDEFKRKIPGRIVGLSKDKEGKPAYRLALQTREQHIRRDKATSNICTAQVLLAIMASMYAVYHGRNGLKAIASEVHTLTASFYDAMKTLGYKIPDHSFFDTISFTVQKRDEILKRAKAHQINLRVMDNELGVSFDEVKTKEDLRDLVSVFNLDGKEIDTDRIYSERKASSQFQIENDFLRSDSALKSEVFELYHSETEMLRYMYRLQQKDLSLATSMIPLGSCTMKLNATAEMMGLSQEKVARMHPFAPKEQCGGYLELIHDLEKRLASLTGFDAVSLQPNAGSQGEFTGLLVIRAYHEKRGEDRNICLIPASAHGTNPASATLAGMKVVVVACDSNGNIDVEDLSKKAKEHSQNLAALMITYPSTHGVFETNVREICSIIHGEGGQVYMDGANMNAQIGLCQPGEYGPDVIHLNLHKTFSIPHGGGGPGMGPICVNKHLAPFLPSHPVVPMGGEHAIDAVSAAPWGSPSILTISWSYIYMMGSEGLREATETAILSANYLAEKLDAHYPVLYKGHNGKVAHECILDMRAIKAATGIDVEDVAKRLMDYGFHAPTVSFPVMGTMMIEPTESESLRELDRFVDALVSIREEIALVENGKHSKENNLLKNAPHSAQSLVKEAWDHPYSREEALFPKKGALDLKFWPAVSRIDNVYGDRNLICTCPSIEDYA